MTPPAAQLMAGIANPPVHIDFVMSFEEGDKQLVEPVMVPEPAVPTGLPRPRTFCRPRPDV